MNKEKFMDVNTKIKAENLILNMELLLLQPEDLVLISLKILYWWNIDQISSVSQPLMVTTAKEMELKWLLN